MRRTKKTAGDRSARRQNAPVSAAATTTASSAAAGITSKADALVSEVLRSDTRHVRVAVNDLVAFEYVDENKSWQWGLGTVAAVPAPRLVQLLRWRQDGRLLHDQQQQQSSSGTSVSPEERERAMARLEELQRLRGRVNEEMGTIQKELAAKQMAYAFSRRRMENAAHAAEQMLVDLRARISEVEASDWREIRCYRNPPEVVVLVMKAVLTLIGERCVSWPHIQCIIRSPEFVRTVAMFDPAKLSAETKETIQSQFLSNPRFTYGDAMNGSQALGYLQQWVVAQLDTAATSEDLAAYDVQHMNEWAEITGMEDQLEALRRVLPKYAKEEERLHAILEGRSAPASNETGLTASSPHDRTADDDTDAKGSSTTDEAESLIGTGAIWSFAEDSLVTLRAAVLCNYGKSESKILRLTAEQVQELKEALKSRDAGWKDEQRADAAYRKLQTSLEELRGEHGRTLQRLQELESSRHETQRELEERQRELETLNQAITEAGLPLQTPLTLSTGSSLPVTPRNIRRRTPRRNIGTPPPDVSNAPYEDTAAEDPAEKIENLEQRLSRALHENPTAAQVQLLEDDLRAVQEELRYTKEELNNFRLTTAPNYYTSSALRMDKDNTPAEQLAAAQRQIEELEAKLEEALLRGVQQQFQASAKKEKTGMEDELRVRIKRMSEEIQKQRIEADAVAEKLNAELHAHGETRQKLADKQRELVALWDRQGNTEGENESTRAALGDSERQLEKLRGLLRAQEEREGKLQQKLYAEQQRWQKSKEPDEHRALQLQEVLMRLREETERQSREAKSTEKVLEEVGARLGMAVAA